MPEEKVEKFAGKWKSPERRQKPPFVTALGHRYIP
jgi:hypothetical protein